MGGEFPGSAGAGGLLAGFSAGSQVAGYRLEEQVGAGGMAVVFRAVDERLGRRVALKILAPALASDEAFRQRFIRESRAAAAVDDPHIIPVHEAGEAGGVLFIAMRYVPGRDVRTLLHREGPLPPGRVAAIVSPVASALDAAHAAGLIHRDVKPANMLLDMRPGRPDHVYLSDFGLSKGALSSVGLTGSGQFLGTPNYTAPEQIEGKPVDGRTDQYALACAAFEMLTGQAPFQRDEATAVIWSHMSTPPPPLTDLRPELPAEVNDVFARALAKAPADRYDQCTDFAEALREALGLTPYSSGPGAIPAPDQSVADHPATRIVWPAEVAASQQGVPVAEAADDVVDLISGSDGTDGGSDTPTASTVTSYRSAPTGGTHPGGRLRRRQVGVMTIAGIGLLAVGIVAATTLVSSPHHQSAGSVHHRSGTAPSRQPTNLPRYSLIRTLTDPAGGSKNYGGDGAYAVAISPNGKTLAVGDNNGRTYLWDPATGTVNATLTNPNTHWDAGSVAFSPDGQRLAVAAAGRAIYLWDVATRTLSASVPHPNDGCCTTVPVAFSPDGQILAVGSGSGRTYLLDGFTGKIIASLTTTLTVGGPNGVFALAFSPDGRALAVGGVNQGTCLWNVATHKQTACIPDPSNQGVDSVAFSPDGKMLATGDGNGKIYLWNVSTRSLSATLTAPGTGKRYVEALAFSPDGQTIAVADSDGNTYLWDVTTRNVTATLAEPAGSPTALAFSPDGRTLATVTPYGSTYLWNLA